MALDNAGNDACEGREVWVTGLGLVSSLGEGGEAHWQALHAAGRRAGEARVDRERFAPYPVHPLAEIDLARQIPNKTDVRQMGPWQCLGTYAAGLALADAGLDDREARAAIHLTVAAGNGERDAAADAAVLAALAAASPGGGGSSGAVLNAALQRALRPTLYLAELTNLLAGNISIVHGVTASSRTFKGEEMAGVAAVEDAVKRIRCGGADLVLVGGASNAERADLMLNLELAGAMWQGEHRSVWERAQSGGGIILGSVGAFLVLEAAPHARARGRRPYAAVTGTAAARGGGAGEPHAAVRALDASLDRQWVRMRGQELPILSGASGAEPATGLERAWLEGRGSGARRPPVRGYGSLLGHTLEAQLPLGLALAALAVSKRQLYGPFDASGYELAHDEPLDAVLVTTFGHWRGAGMALLETPSQAA